MKLLQRFCVVNLADKRIVVTGGAGFLGSYIVDKLRERGCQNIFIPRSSEYDLRVKQDVIEMYRMAKPNIIIHSAAAVGGIEWNRNNPAKSMYDNLTMSLHLMEEGKLTLEKFVMISSVCAYPGRVSFPTKESCLWQGYPEESHGSYGVSKRVLLDACRAYRQQYNLNAIGLVPVNLYGPNDSFGLKNCHVMPALIRKFVEAKQNNASEVVIWGTGAASREFLYVEDCAEAIVLATERYDSSDPVNIGSGEEIRIIDLAYKIKKLLDFSGRIMLDSSKPDGQERRLFDVTKAKEFGFTAKTTLDEGLRKTIDWYRSSRA